MEENFHLKLKNLLIKHLLAILPILIKPVWQCSNLRVLIFESDTFRSKLFKNKIEELLNSNDRTFEFKIVHNKISFIRHSRGANIIFSYGLSNYANTDNLKLLYLGVVGDAGINRAGHFKIVSSPNFASEYIGDYVIASIFAFERNLQMISLLKKSKKWKQHYFIRENIRPFASLKIGILGLGRIGHAIAERFIKLGNQVHVYDVDINKNVEQSIKYSYNDWQNMLDVVDYFIVAINSDSINTKIINRNIISRMNPNLCLVNVARGALIDEEAIVEALCKRKIKGAILDVFSQEPLNRKSHLWELDNVFLTPHIAGNINLVFEKIVDDFFAEIKNII